VLSVSVRASLPSPPLIVRLLGEVEAEVEEEDAS
jgi:hypothetical protein